MQGLKADALVSLWAAGDPALRENTYFKMEYALDNNQIQADSGEESWILDTETGSVEKAPKD